MAKSDFEKAPINWNGSIDHPDAGLVGGSIPKNIKLGNWGDNSYSWDDVSFVIEIADGIGTYNRQERLDKLLKDKKKKTKLIIKPKIPIK